MGKKTSFIEWNDKDSEDNDAGKKISNERRNEGRRSLESDEQRNEAIRGKRRKRRSEMRGNWQRVEKEDQYRETIERSRQK